MQGVRRHEAYINFSLKIFTTSRDVRDIGESMKLMGAEIIATMTRSVDADIRLYVSSERDKKLSRCYTVMKTLVEQMLASKADGM